ncbi:hypothetical protein GCM10029964_078640 [Kibdelosporangium lantanae]
MISPAADDALARVFDRFGPQVNEHVAAARAHLAGWVRDHRLVLATDAHARFDLADFGWFAARTYPTADGAGLALVADWFAWLFLLDDHLDDGALGREPERLAPLLGQLDGVLAGAGAPPDAPPIVTSLADLWERTAPLADKAWRQRFVAHMAEGAAAAFWESGNRVRGTVPEEAEYVTRRRHSGAIYVCMDLIEPVCGITCSPTDYDGPVFQEALRAACDVVCWTNDFYSLAKERSLGEYHNLVHIVGHHRGLDVEAAAWHVIGLIRTEVDRFVGARDHLPRVRAVPGGNGVVDARKPGLVQADPAVPGRGRAGRVRRDPVVGRLS